MRTNLNAAVGAMFFLAGLLLAPALARAEGSADFGINQDLCEVERNYTAGAVVYGPITDIGVDILQVGETINISVGDNGAGNTVNVEIFDASFALVDTFTSDRRTAGGSWALR